MEWFKYSERNFEWTIVQRLFLIERPTCDCLLIVVECVEECFLHEVRIVLAGPALPAHCFASTCQTFDGNEICAFVAGWLCVGLP